MPTCFICKNKLSSFKLLSDHFKLIHDNTQFERFKCCEEGCSREFALLNSFRKHLKSHNASDSSTKNKEVSSKDINSQVTVDSTETNDLTTFEQTSSLESSSSCQSTFVNITENFQSRLVKFCASLYAKPNIPRNTIQFVIEGLGSVVVEGLRETSKTLLDTNEISPEGNAAISTLVNTVEQSVDALGSEHKRFKFFETEGSYIPPEQYVIGETLMEVRKNNISQIVPTVCTQQVIPLRSVLKKFFEKQNILDETFKFINNISKDTCSSLYTNFIQGTVWQSKIQSHKGDVVFPLFLYFDDFETGNPLGSHAGFHKLGAVYASVPCLPPHYTSLLRNIFLVLLFHSEDRISFGNNIVFKPVIDELNYLKENGVFIEAGSFKGIIKFELALLIGDNLGLHSICGFVESFSSNFPCRYCKSPKEMLKTQCWIDNSLLRTKESYELDSAECQVSISGIKEPCVWQNVGGFDIIDQMGVDAMHDLLEGVCKYDIVFLLSYYVINLKLFSLQSFNERLNNFDFGPDVNSKPVPIMLDHLKKCNIRMSASEMLVLVRYFGLLVGDLIPVNECVWSLYSLLRQILDLVLSPTFQKDSCQFLQTLVSEHHQVYLQYSGKYLTPKFHLLLHYPDMVKKFGPLVALWSMRFEAKHRISKLAASSSSSRRNICKSVAIKHQLQLNDMYLSKVDNVLKSSNLTPIENDFDKIEISSVIDVNIKSIDSVSWVDVKGTKYQQNSILTIEIKEDEFPQFGKIQCIFVVNKDIVLFKCNVLRSISYNVHLSCWEVEYEKGVFRLVLYKDLPNHVPNNINKAADGLMYVTVRCCL